MRSIEKNKIGAGRAGEHEGGLEGVNRRFATGGRIPLSP